MHCTKKINEDITWVGGNDRRLALFENVYPIERGTSYNSYFVKDEKTVLIDTVDKNVSMQFFENLEYALGGRKLDYVIVNHMEPDHSATLQELVLRYPEVTVVCNKKTVVMIKQFFNFDIDSRVQLVVEGDTLNTGKHTFTFVFAPMVHWPEVMVTYDVTDKILFSADAFGTFGALDGNIFADEVDFKRDWLDDARRYYTNIVGKYGPQVQNLLKKAANIEIKMICPLHGPVWRKNLNWFIDKYQKWSSYTPEIESVLILSGSVYGHTENAAEVLASRLYDLGIKGVKIYDVSKTHPSYIVAEAFKYSHIVIAAATYNAGIFTPMETVLLDLKAHNLKNRTIGLMYNGSWVPVTEKVFTNIFETMSGIKMLEHSVKIMSTLKPHQEDEIEAMAQELVKTYASVLGEKQKLFKTEKTELGKCPRCQSPVYEGKKNYYCSNKECGFAMWKNDRFFEERKTAFTPKIAAALLKSGKVKVKKLYSVKTGKTYDGTVLLADTGGKYVNYKVTISKDKELE